MEDETRAGETPLLLNRYRIEGKLGEGGLGTVVKAYDTRLKSMRAIKTLKRTLTTDAEAFRGLEERFTREAEAGSRMGINPNLVAVYDLVADAGGTLYLILEYVPGGTLDERIKRGTLPLADALRLTAEAARGLRAAHDVGIVHRDIKPANIFLATDGRAQVGDFGIAQIDDISGRTRTTVGHPGTPLYMSPEQAHMTAYVQPATDQYSLGLVLFEMLVGTPYRRLSKQEASARIANQPPPVVALIERMTAEDAEQRYPSMGAVLTAIQAIERYVLADDIETAPPLAPSPADDEGATRTAPPPGTQTPYPDARTPITNATSGTPPVNLQPVPPVLHPPPPGPSTTKSGANRGLLIGVGALLVALIVGLGGFFALRGGGSSTTTATSTPSVAAQSTTSTATAAATTVSVAAQPSATPPAAATTTPPVTAAASITGAPATTSAPAAPAVAAPPPVTSLLSYLDGRVALPGERRAQDGKTIIGDPVQVVGVDLSRNEPSRLSTVSGPAGSRVIRTLWAPQGTLLATIVRAPVAGGFSESLDLIVLDIATGKSTTVAKGINTLPSWSPDSTTLVYGLITGPEKFARKDDKGMPITFAGGTPDIVQTTAFDVHLVNADGTKDRVIAHLLPSAQCGGGGGLSDPIVEFVGSDQFLTAGQQTAWAADDSQIAISVSGVTFAMRPDGSNLKQVVACKTPDLTTIVGATTADPYIPANGVQVRVQDDDDALRWRYERGLLPTTILTGCTADPNDRDKPCDNTKKGTANAGYRNQIIARLADGTEKPLTKSPTFKYQVSVSPDGTAVAFTGITVTDYAAAARVSPNGGYPQFTGYSVDTYIVRLNGGAEVKVSTNGAGHHPSWQRDIPVKIAPVPTPIPTTAPTPAPPTAVPPRTPTPARTGTGTAKP